MRRCGGKSLKIDRGLVSILSNAWNFREGRIQVLVLQQRTSAHHVHVRYGGGEAVFEVENEVELRESHGLKVGELSKAQMLAELNKNTIIEKWHEFFN
jgi:hypothetical protein